MPLSPTMRIAMLASPFLYLGLMGSNPANAKVSFPSKEAAMPFDYKQQPNDFYEKHLSKEAYAVCREKGTEKAFSGKYDKFYEAGTYSCACCGGDYPLFSSAARFDSGTGWPSFWAPIDPTHVTLVKEERSIYYYIFGARTEVLCTRCGSHLGHVFDDGPQDHGGKRYCMNSVALSFTPEGEAPVRTYSVNE